MGDLDLDMLVQVHSLALWQDLTAAATSLTTGVCFVTVTSDLNVCTAYAYFFANTFEKVLSPIF